MKVLAADILVPKCDLYKFCCVACDQFTGDAEYWRKAEEISKNSPAAINIVFPEIYLSKDNALRTESINKTMENYLENGVFEEHPDSVFYIERTLNDGRIRKGVVAKIDLEEYDYSKNTRSAIRPTEGTIEDRLPPRVAIRKNAPLELPHIMLLINDEKREIIEGLENKEKTLVYSTPLMLSGGSIKGYKLEKSVQNALLKTLNVLETGRENNKITLAVGDGNHSLATAKKCWEMIKPNLSAEERENHPARFALCEIVNLHSPALDFEPIHRIVYNVDVNAFVGEFMKHSAPNGQECMLLFGNEKKKISLSPNHYLTVGTVQNIIDAYVKEHGGEVDYIHEPEQAEENAKTANTVGILVDGLKKSDLFDAVVSFGALPRKTFSMGMGIDKRYYLESRKIK